MRPGLVWTAAGALSGLLWFASVNLVAHGHTHVLRDTAQVVHAARSGLGHAHQVEGRLLGDRNA